MTNKIILKKSAVPSKVPLSADLEYGELAINYADGVLYYKNTSNIVSSFSGGSMSASQILSALLTVDGASSGLDADLLDGQHGAYYLDWTNVTNKPDPTITLGGDLTGSVTLTDLASGTLTATIAANSVALGTDTTGNYAADITQGTGISISGSAGEGTQYTISNAGVLSVNGATGTITGIATTGATLAQFAATTSAQLAGVISDETGSGALVFAGSPALTGTPTITTAGFAGIEYWNNGAWQVYIGSENNTTGARYNSRTGVHTWYNNSTQTAQLSGNNLTIVGTLYAASKSFLIPHPTKPGKKLRYGSLEGPENGVYVRGKLKGSSVIELPEYWTKLVDPDSITVNLTCIGKYQKLYVMEIKDNKVYVGNENLWGSDFECFYTVYGERVDVDKLEVEID